MTFTIEIDYNTYCKWNTFADWQVDWGTDFTDWLLRNHPEIISTDIGDGSRTFTFESEAHYTWFLLQQ